MDRRNFLIGSAATAALSAFAESAPPIKIGHRQANMAPRIGLDVFELARKIPGLSGVELQMIYGGRDLSERSVALEYKRMANRWGMQVPSIAGIWKPGQKIFDTPVAAKVLSNSIQAAELMGASTVLVALFTFASNCPNMADEKSYGPVVSVFQSVAKQAADAGVKLAIETSLTPEEDRKLVDMVGSDSVKVYYDANNEEVNHPGQAIPGIKLVGSRIAQVHLKNQKPLIFEEPATVNWNVALKTLRGIGYNGWYVFETEHKTAEQCIAETNQNIELVRKALLAS